MRINDIAAYMEWKRDGMQVSHPWFPLVTDDMSCDAAYDDNTFVLHQPPEYTLPEWDPLVPIDWAETHDWTYDYDEYYDYEDYVRYERDYDYDDV